MANEHGPTDDIFYNLVSIQYHALQGAELYGKYLEDAHDHENIAEFIRDVQEQDRQRAIRCHELLGELTGTGRKS